MRNRRDQKDFRGLVEVMIELKLKCIELMQYDPHNHFEIDYSRVEIHFLNTIKSLNRTTDEVLAFGYELRRQDLADDHSAEFLSGLIQPSILVDIILSNYWDADDQRMKCDMKKKFRVAVGESHPLVYLKNHFRNFN